MIVGIGVDICQISRLERTLQRFGHRVARRVLHPLEMPRYQRCRNDNQRVHYLAKRFAGKEAVAKALGTGLSHGVYLRSIAITNKPSGQPQVVLDGDAQHYANKLNINAIHISISDEQAYAIAYVVCES